MRRHTLTTAASALACASGLNLGLRVFRRLAGRHAVYILAYHDVTRLRADEREGTICAQRFRAHLEFLRRHYRVVPLAEAVDRLAGRSPLETDFVAITFDDGYAGNYSFAWPILRSLGLTATIFVTTGFIDGVPLWFHRVRDALAALKQRSHEDLIDLRRRIPALEITSAEYDVERLLRDLKRMTAEQRDSIVAALVEEAALPASSARAMTWDQIRELSAAGIEIGCHTVSHPILSHLSPDRQKEEILSASRRLEQEIGHPPRFFAFPNGSAFDFNHVSLGILRDAGFRAAVTMIRGSNGPSADLLALKRIGVGSDPPFVLSARLSGLFNAAVTRLSASKASMPSR